MKIPDANYPNTIAKVRYLFSGLSYMFHKGINRQLHYITAVIGPFDASKNYTGVLLKKIINKTILELYRNSNDIENMSFRVASLNAGKIIPKKILKFRFSGCHT